MKYIPFCIKCENINFLPLRLILLFNQTICDITSSGVVGGELLNFDHISKTLVI